ncbi:CHASE2 domain-containing protein [Nitrobacter winogradskyi]|uniref:Adenylate/guanylate cyclase domain-containing protein n=2 Tax=Nitrobacter winogradskyi TaxID=913 RepID=A0A4Y3WAR5_NITWI|nr:adenylate/guanylate cyclase domain-containing protein [Nitrobacter winogradskyi]MCP1998209.1 adenylate cyclase [Nitrobacter winogradskyi]GEC15201.1 adenylate/guanylate cyclase domain-containing protein [Nitrobacter winogradskyi]
MKAATRLRNTLRVRTVLAWARLRRLTRNKNLRAIGAAVVTLVLLASLRAYDPRIVTELKERTFDTYQRLKPRAYTDLPVRIVDIDEASISEYGQWPWPRTRLAALTRRLADLGAGVVAYDVIFSEPDRTTPSRLANDLKDSGAPDLDQTLKLLANLPDHDQAFADAIENTGVVLGFAATGAVNDKRPPVRAGVAFVGVNPANVLAPFRGTVSSLPILNQKAAGIGGINLSSHDRGGIVRRVPMLFSDGASIYPSLAIEALRVAQSQKSIIVRGTGSSGDSDTGSAALIDMRVGAFKLPLTSNGESWVYFNRDRPQRYVSVKDILDPAKEATVKPLVDGAIVLVGASAAGLMDSRTTPLGGSVPGVSVQAQVIEQILAQDFIERPDWAKGLEIVLTLLFGALVAGLVLMFGARFSFYAGVVGFVAGLAGSWIAFAHFRLLIDPIFPSLAALTVYIAVERVLHVASDREKKFVRQAFGQYLAPELLTQLENSPQGMRLGGASRDISVMFMDVRGFTPISEALTATELVDFINTLLAPLSDAIQDELGTIDKYIGDSIMAFWNAPADVPDHATRACQAALKMREALAALNDADVFEFSARGFADPRVRIGIGINAGLACVGNMGSQRRFNYSAMGDVVNVAARIESASKTLDVDLLVSEDVARRVRGIALLEAGEILLKGKSRPTKIYAIVGDDSVAASPEFSEWRARHGALLAAIKAGEGLEAAAALARCQELAGEDMQGFYRRLAEQIAPLHAT